MATARKNQCFAHSSEGDGIAQMDGMAAFAKGHAGRDLPDMSQM